MQLLWRKKTLRAYFDERSRQRRKIGLHVGCGESPLSGWYNCDRDPVGREVNYVDASRPLPFASETFDLVFTEHFIEHLSFGDAQRFLREAHRVLRPDGVIRTATPSLEFVHDLLEGKTPLHREYVRWFTRRLLPDQPESAVSVVNKLFYGFGHRFLYDRQTLRDVLSQAGFREVRDCKAGSSPLEELVGIEQHGNAIPPLFNELETMVIEAVK